MVDGVRGGDGGEAITFFRFVFLSLSIIVRVFALALSSAKTSQNALCVMKLSLLDYQSKTKKKHTEKY